MALGAVVSSFPKQQLQYFKLIANTCLFLPSCSLTFDWHCSCLLFVGAFKTNELHACDNALQPYWRYKPPMPPHTSPIPQSLCWGVALKKRINHSPLQAFSGLGNFWYYFAGLFLYNNKVVVSCTNNFCLLPSFLLWEGLCLNSFCMYQAPNHIYFFFFLCLTDIIWRLCASVLMFQLGFQSHW